MNSKTHLYPESTTLITVRDTPGVQLKQETYIAWSIALNINIFICLALHLNKYEYF